MLDAFKNIAGGRSRLVQKQTEELELLIVRAREERGAISAMLTALTTSGVKLAPLGKSLEQVTDKATSVTSRIGEITKRLSALDDRSKELEEVERRIQALQDVARQAEQTTQKAIGPDGELQKHREAVQHLSSQALQTQATLETLQKERAVLDEFRGQLREAEQEVKQSLALATSLKTELDQVRAVATALTQDYGKIRETSREAREDTNAALATVKEVESRLGPLARLHELSQSTEERLSALNALAEHVTRKAKALESQQQAVEHAVVQANRVNEMVWAMDVQIGKLNEGMKQATKAEETISRIEKLSEESARRMDGAVKLHQETQRAASKLQKDSTQLLDVVRSEVGALTIRKKEFEAFEERLRALQGTVADAETRMETLAAKDKHLVALSQKADVLSKQFETLFVQSDELGKKQLALETLHERLGQVDDLAKKTTWQIDSLKRTRQDLDVVRKEIQDFHKSHVEVGQLRDKVGADRRALEAFGERLNAMSTRAPELEAKMDAILGKMTLVEEGTQKATRLNEAVAELDVQLSRVTARVPFVEKLEGRLDGLNTLSAEVDQRLETQLARRTEIETLTTACDGLAEQIVDAQHKLEAVRALQGRLLPLIADLKMLKEEVGKAHERIQTVKADESTMAEQEKRFTELVAASKAVAVEVFERTRQMQVLSEELARSTGIRDELLVDLDRVQNRQRDTVSHIQASEDQLSRAEKMFKQLEQRRAQVAFGEKKLAAVETRLAEIKQLGDEIEKNIQAITTRQQLVSTVKSEVEQVYQISARSKADLAHVAEHRGEVAALKTRVDELLSRIAETDERIAAIDGRRKLVDEVQTKANAIVHLLDDVRISVETIGEHKAVVDHVAEKVAQLEFMLQEARNTLRALQNERELAERIEQGIKQLRSRTGGPEEGRRSVSV